MRELAEFAVTHWLAAISPFRSFTEAGGRMAGGPQFDEFRLRSASYVDTILEGANPGDLPIGRPTRFELMLNLKTAKILGITIPQYLLLRADEVIESRGLMWGRIRPAAAYLVRRIEPPPPRSHDDPGLHSSRRLR